jgi:hypothetical protein
MRKKLFLAWLLICPLFLHAAESSNEQKIALLAWKQLSHIYSIYNPPKYLAKNFSTPL